MRITYFLILILFFSCKEETKIIESNNGPESKLKLVYAKGFSIDYNGNFKVLTIKSPWPKSTETFRYALINREKAASITLMRDEYDGIILTPVERLVVTSTTHLPALELLEASHTLIGFPETDYISSKIFQNMVESGKIRELGKHEEINTEVLLELNPELVVGFGVEGSNRVFEQIENANIPVIYNGDWVEKSPLAKAEWLKFFGTLLEKEEQANTIFREIEKDYIDAKKLASKVGNSPSALSGAMHKDIWYLPSATSPEAQFFNDANINYLWKDTHGSGSLALSFETVFERAKNAELWFSPSYYESYDDLRNANMHYSQFNAFKTKSIYSFVNTKGDKGGVLYYELGTTRPDLVLKDLIKIAHPNLLKDYNLTFFKPLR